MRNDELRARMTRLADAKLARRAELLGETDPPPAPPAPTDRIFRVGDRVFDLRGGREGEVFDVRPADPGGAGLVYVRFVDGSSGTRAASDLVARPTPPPGRT